MVSAAILWADLCGSTVFKSLTPSCVSQGKTKLRHECKENIAVRSFSLLHRKYSW